MSLQGNLTMMTAAILSVACTSATAQDGPAMERMENELCGCMTMVDVKAGNAVFEKQVRHCLEEAVVNHPAAMNALLKTSNGEGSKGFQLGELISRRLAPRCPALRKVSERLRTIHPAGATTRSES